MNRKRSALGVMLSLGLALAACSGQDFGESGNGEGGAAALSDATDLEISGEQMIAEGELVERAVVEGVAQDTTGEESGIEQGLEDALAKETLAGGTSSAPTKLAVLLWDGSSSKGAIKTAFKTAINATSGWSSYYRWYMPGRYDYSDGKSKINDAAKKLGVSKSKQSLLIVGKSLGGAKTYGFSNSQTALLDDFYRTAVVIIDAHEPGAPADYGRCNRWYDHVRFRCHASRWNRHYDLAWRTRWDTEADAGRLAFFNIYQREDNIRGYRFSRAPYHGGANQKVSLPGTREHFDITNSSQSRAMIKKAIQFLLK